MVSNSCNLDNTVNQNVEFLTELKRREKMKKILRRSLVVLTMLMAIAMTQISTLNVSAASSNCFSVGGLKYKVIKNCNDTNNVMCVGLAKGNKNATDVNIPSTVTCNNKSYDVTQIKNSAFCNNKKLQDVTIPKSVTNVGNNAFKNCSNLSDLNILNSNTALKNNSFSNCKNIIVSQCFAR